MSGTVDGALQSTTEPGEFGLGQQAVGLLALGSQGFRSAALEPGGELLVGRHHSCQLSLPDRALSRYHARFSRRADRVVVEDLGSRYGTWLDGKRVEFAELVVGASVRLGDVVVAVTPGLAPAGSARARPPRLAADQPRLRSRSQPQDEYGR